MADLNLDKGVIRISWGSEDEIGHDAVSGVYNLRFKVDG